MSRGVVGCGQSAHAMKTPRPTRAFEPPGVPSTEQARSSAYGSRSGQSAYARLFRQQWPIPRRPRASLSSIDHVGQTVTVRGWVTHVRSSGKVAFAVLRDGTGIMQAVFVKTQLPPDVWERFKELTLETSVHVTGEVRAEPRAPGGYEMGVTGLTIIGPSPIDYPIQPKEHGIDFLLDHRHFWLRSNRVRAIFSIRNEIEQAIHDFFYERGFLRVDTPILTAAIGERSGLFATEVLRRGHGVPRADGPAVRRSRGGGVRKDLHVRPDVPRREVEDAPPPHRILDDRARSRVERLGRQHAAAGGFRLVPRAAVSRTARAPS